MSSRDKNATFFSRKCEKKQISSFWHPFNIDSQGWKCPKETKNSIQDKIVEARNYIFYFSFYITILSIFFSLRVPNFFLVVDFLCFLFKKKTIFSRFMKGNLIKLDNWKKVCLKAVAGNVQVVSNFTLLLSEVMTAK